MASEYVRVGAPFDFLGHFTESQKEAFKTWVEGRKGNFPAIRDHHRMRAQQLRKTAGMLEAFYAKEHIEALSPSFKKEAWQPGPDGHWPYAYGNDHFPAMTMREIKDQFRYQMELQNEAVFHMNHLRNQIEVQEDKAQYAHEAAGVVDSMMQRIDALFTQPEYQAVLVRDVSDPYKGEPRFRVNQMDKPTAWEIDQSRLLSSS
jgi:hypothetical protein